jgi:hypothetical protein
MSYIINSTSPFVSIKLTEKGREQLAQGKLNFSYWAIGDSEINYEREQIVDNDPSLTATTAVFKPFDRQPNIKSFIYPSATSEFYQPVNASVINVVKAIVNNEAKERGFFSGTTYETITDLDYCAYNEYVVDSTPGSSRYDGSNILTVGSSAFTTGDFVLIKFGDYSTGSLTQNDNTVALPNLWYKIQALTAGTSSIIELDRNLPNLNGTWTGNSQIFIYKGGEVYDSFGFDTTSAYWDTGTLSFDSANNITCNDIPVWNMNNVWCESLAGITGLSTTNLYEGYTKFGSFQYLGTKNPYLEFLCATTADSATAIASICGTPGQSYPDDVSKSISILHYTNNAISNLYGEFFYTDVSNNKYLSIYIPDLMYHRRDGSTGSGTTMGMRFIATGSTFTTGQDIEYIDLIEDPTMIASAATSIAVGRVYPQLKTVVFYDDEIVAAMSYKSNRNWTLPELSATLAAPSGGTSTGVLNTNDTMYLTYVLDNIGYTGYSSSLPCQKYIKITNSTSTAKDVQFKINETDFLPFMRKIESAGYDGLGFYAHNFKLLYQIVPDATDRPDPGAWKQYDFTSTLITTNAGETIDPKLLENQSPTTNGFVLDVLKDTSATTFNLISLLNLPPTVSPEKLQFGDERFFYGNLSTYIGATIYKTIFDVRVNSNQFNLTTNTTRSSDLTTNPPNLRVSEVGVYDAEKNLVCIGKLSTPVTLGNGNTIMIELSMDF